MAVPIRVPSRCRVKALLSPGGPIVSASPRAVLRDASNSLHHLILGQVSTQFSHPPKSSVLLTIMVSEVFIPWRRIATRVKTSMRGP